ncbi:unnamed protein product [Schistosoma mattheei]|uniref:Uncharacterized protein n=1 Tax=Schistosoma mattheei TaxID=31246 RepID=A0A183Q2M9_9TREM|nr:unnamed protein product [Schistosoma mattheei]
MMMLWFVGLFESTVVVVGVEHIAIYIQDCYQLQLLDNNHLSSFQLNLQQDYENLDWFYMKTFTTRRMQIIQVWIQVIYPN